MSLYVPPSSLVSDLKGLVVDEVLIDVTFLIDGEYVLGIAYGVGESSGTSVQVISRLLMYFAAMFTGGMTETMQSLIAIERKKTEIGYHTRYKRSIENGFEGSNY